MQQIDNSIEVQRVRSRIATALFRRRDRRRRRMLIWRYAVALVLLFIAHSYFSNLSSPLKLIPQTLAAIAMGYLVMLILSLRHFKYVAEFIDWGKVIASARCPACGCGLRDASERCPGCGLVLGGHQQAA